MQDYKFRQSDLSSRTSRNLLRSAFLGAAVICLLLAGGYALLQYPSTGKPGPQRADPGSDIIPLSLPPPPETPEGVGGTPAKDK
jgi:hypothetical protein